MTATYRGTPIAGTTVFTGARSRQAYRINKFAMSLTDPSKRDAFRADERGYIKVDDEGRTSAGGVPSRLASM